MTLEKREPVLGKTGFLVGQPPKEKGKRIGATEQLRSTIGTLTTTPARGSLEEENDLPGTLPKVLGGSGKWKHGRKPDGKRSTFGHVAVTGDVVTHGDSVSLARPFRQAGGEGLF